ncbi:MAG: EamA family transporter [Firmicutes bacterium]|nr:EamA family transporter [Bacillota bacterium]
MNTKHSKYGALVAIVAAIFWGFSGCCSQYIFENFTVDAAHLTSFRMLSAGAIVVLAGFATGKLKGSDDMTAIWKDRSDVIQLIIFSIFGIMLCQLSYQKAIYWTNSSTATIIQYTGPVMIMALTCAMAHRLPTRKEVAAIILAMTGTFLLATHGDIHSMVLTPRGLAWGLFAAVTMVTYNMLPQKLIKKYGSMCVTGYGMVLGGIVLTIITRAWEAAWPLDLKLWLAFGGVVFFGTVLSFTMFLWGVAQIGPVKASLIASLEPVAATVIMIIWLHADFLFMDLMGFTCIFLTVFLLLKKDDM